MFKRLSLLLFVLLLPGLLARPASAEPIVLVAVGDLLLGGSAGATLQAQGNAYPFAATASLLRGADIAVANLEAPLTDGGAPVADKTFTFRVPMRSAAAIEAAGIDVLTLANNHLGDYGPQGVLDTRAALAAAGLHATGAGKDLAEARRPTAIAGRHGSVGFLAYSNTLPTDFYATASRPGTAPGWPALFRADIERLKRYVDYVVVSFHWGAEKMTAPKDYQRQYARLAIDAGADVVLGHHPHVLQGAEWYKGRIIFYSLGNYAFGSWSRNAQVGGLAKVVLDGGAVTSAALLPLNVANHQVQFQPRPLADDVAFGAEFNAQCAPLGATATRQPDGFWALQPLAPTPPPAQLAKTGQPDLPN